MDGINCEDGPQNCVEANHTAENKCVRCTLGYEVDSTYGHCTKCKGNTYSDDGLVCKTGPENCDSCIHDKKECQKCSVGFVPINGPCEHCEGNKYSDDGLTCQPGPAHCAKLVNSSIGM